MPRLCAPILALSFCFSAHAFTIEQILSAPFPLEIAAAPDGGAVAWIFNERGARNVWIAAPPAYEGRRLTAYTEDDGQEMTALAWTHDAASLLYVRGGDANAKGELPNPASDPAGVERAIWMIPVAGGDPQKVADGAGFALSPVERTIAYLNKGEVWTKALDDPAAELKSILKARGSLGTLRWSPDGKRLAFVSGRGDTSFVGVLDLAAASVTWMAPSVDRDSAPVWSPDGTRIAFIRLPTPAPSFTFEARRVGVPWQILVCDPQTGEGSPIFRADDGPGSVFHGVVATDQLFWTAAHFIVFPWEKTGWTLLYAIPAAGGSPRVLTPGEFEVEHVAVAPDRNTLYYSSNENDIDRRHLWRVTPDASAPESITSGAGIEWSPAPLGDAIAFLRSDAHRPARPAIRLPNGETKDLAPGAIPEDFPSRDFVDPQPIEYAAADGMLIRGQLFLPRDLEPGERRPAAIFFHGGSRRQMLLGFHYGDYYHNAYAFNQYLASKGFVVLSANYRSGTGYGLEFREALNYGATGASEFNDVIGAGLYLRNRPDVDPGRIALWGGSYGGYLTAMGLARAPDLFAAGVDVHGVHDWNPVIKNFIPRYDTLREPERARLAFESSPMYYVDNWRAPVLLIHGDDDRNVPFSETSTLVERLRNNGVAFEQLIFPDEVHGFLRHRNWIRAYIAAADFLERKLAAR